MLENRLAGLGGIGEFQIPLALPIPCRSALRGQGRGLGGNTSVTQAEGCFLSRKRPLSQTRGGEPFFWPRAVWIFLTSLSGCTEWSAQKLAKHLINSPRMPWLGLPTPASKEKMGRCL